MTEEQVLSKLEAVEAELSDVRGQLVLLKQRTAQISNICWVLGSPLSVVPRAELNPGGPANPLGQAWLKKSSTGAELLGGSIRWNFADGLRRLFHEVDELHRATHAL